MTLEAKLRNSEDVNVIYRTFTDSLDDHLMALLTSDFILCKDGDMGVIPFCSRALEVGGALHMAIRNKAIHPSLVRRVALPDGASAFILGPNELTRDQAEAIKSHLLRRLTNMPAPQRPERILLPNDSSRFASFPPKIGWTRSPNALWYAVRIEGAVGAAMVNVCGERLFIPKEQCKLMPDGRYSISVSAMNLNGRSDWASASFTVGKNHED